jgi:hypothetical protein
MSTSGEQFAYTLQALIQRHQVGQICIYQFSSAKLYDQSSSWSFGHEFIQVGDSSYNLNRLVKFQVTASTLCLYF